jgi:hypothetical protein
LYPTTILLWAGEMVRKDIAQAALETVKEFFQPPEGNALLPVLQAEEGRRRDTKHPGKLRVRGAASPLLEEFSEAPVHARAHGAEVAPERIPDAE